MTFLEQRAWPVFLAITWLLFSGFSAGAASRHIIISYDVSGSMREDYLGDSYTAENIGVHALLSKYIEEMLFSPNGPVLTGMPTASSPDGWVQVHAAAGFEGFPLVHAPEHCVVSALSFGDRITITGNRIFPDPAKLPDLLPTRFTDQQTVICEATRKVTSELYDSTRDVRAYWLFISDGLDDPKQQMDCSDVWVKRRADLLYALTIHAPEALRENWKRQRDTSPGLQAAFPTGMPDRAAIWVYHLQDWFQPPRQVSAVLAGDASPGVPPDTLRVSWYPGEWEPSLGMRGENLAAEQARFYRVQTSRDKEFWSDFGANIPATRTYPYSVDGPIPLSDPVFYVRVEAQGEERSRAAFDTPVVRVQVDLESKTLELPATPPDLRLKVQRLPRGTTAWETIEEDISGDARTLQLDRAESGDRFHVVALQDYEHAASADEYLVKDFTLPLADAPPAEGETTPQPAEGETGVPTLEPPRGVAAKIDPGLGIVTVSWRLPRDGAVGIVCQRRDEGDQWRELNAQNPVPSNVSYWETEELNLGDTLRLVAVSNNEISEPSDEVTVGAAGCGAGGIVVALVAALAILGALALLILKFRPRRVAFTLEWVGHTDDAGDPTIRDCVLNSKERYEFCEMDQGMEKSWPEVDAPDHYLENRGPGRIYHAWTNEEGEIEEDLLEDETTFEVENASGVQSELVFRLGSGGGSTDTESADFGESSVDPFADDFEEKETEEFSEPWEEDF